MLTDREENKPTKWRWIEGEVDPTLESIKIIYGSIHDNNRDNWISVAFIAPPQDNIFKVHFLITASNPVNAAILDAVLREIDLYLIQKKERDPWGYAIYHCGTTSNVYSNCHWLYYNGK